MVKTATLFPDDDRNIPAGEPSAKNVCGAKRRPAGTDLGFANPSEPRPYENGTLTSRAGADFSESFVSSQVARVHAFISSQGDHGATDKEIQAALELDGNSERPRRVWLRANGFILPKGAPSAIVVRDRSTVWVSVRPPEQTSARTRYGRADDA